MALEAEELNALLPVAWAQFCAEFDEYQKIDNWYRGRVGAPEVKDAPSDIKDLAKNSIRNVMPLVMESFTSPLSVVGFRASSTTDLTTDENLEAFRYWQERKFDDRQDTVHEAANAYGTSFVFADGPAYIGSPLNAFALYEDPNVDDYPVYGFRVSWDDTGAGPIRRVMHFYDESNVYEYTIGTIPRTDYMKSLRKSPRSLGFNPVYEKEWSHGFAVCPIIRFGTGKSRVVPLVERQRELNMAVFIRDCVLKYGAHPQKVIIGWKATAEERVKAGVSSVVTFEDPDVKVESFQPADPNGYNDSIDEIKLDIATNAVIPLGGIAPMANLSAEAIAAAEAPYQRALGRLQRHFGERWELLLRLLAARDGIEVPEDAEVRWDETQPRSFAQVVDAIQKLGTIDTGLALEALDMIPDWSQARVERVKKAIKSSRGSLSLVERLAAQPTPPETTDSGE